MAWVTLGGDVGFSQFTNLAMSVIPQIRKSSSTLHGESLGQPILDALHSRCRQILLEGRDDDLRREREVIQLEGIRTQYSRLIT